MQILTQRCALLGLTCSSEPTQVLMISILLMAAHNGPTEDLTIDAQRAFALLKDLKVVMKAKAKKAKHSGVTVYPAEPGQLPEAIYKAAYQHDEAPVECPLDTAGLQNLAGDLPMRKTHTSVTIRGRSAGHYKTDEALKEWMWGALCSKANFQFPIAAPQPPPKTRVTLLGNNRKRPLALTMGDENTTEENKDLETAEVQAAKDGSEAMTPEEAKETVPKQNEKPTCIKSIDAMANDVLQQLEHNKAVAKEKKAATTPNNKKKEKAHKKTPKNKSTEKKQQKKKCWVEQASKNFGIPRD